MGYYILVTRKRKERNDNNKQTTKKQEKVNHFDKRTTYRPYLKPTAIEPTLISDPSVFYFFSTAQNILKFCHRTIGTFASRTSRHKNPGLQKSQFSHPPQNENDRLIDENSYFNQLKLNFN